MDSDQKKEINRLFKRNGLYKLGRDRNLAQQWLHFEVSKHVSSQEPRDPPKLPPPPD